MDKSFKLQISDVRQYEQIIGDPVLLRYCEMPNSWREEVEFIYYDTPDRRLTKAGVAYRVRQQGEKQIATVDNLHGQKWDKVLEGAAPDISLFRDSPIGRRLQVLPGEVALEPLFTCRLERWFFNLSIDNESQVKVIADKGEIVTDKHKETVAQLRFKHKGGDMRQMLKLAVDLTTNYPLVLEPQSVYLRGLKLAGFVTYPEESPKIVDLDGNEPAAKALRKILFGCLLRVIKAQQDFLEQPADPEKLHQFRVKLRQLRAVFSFSRPFFRQAKFAELQEALRQLGMELSYIRELDVLAIEWEKFLNSQEDYSHHRLLAGVLREKRTTVNSQVLAKFLRGRATKPLLEFWAGLLDEQGEDTDGPAVSITNFADQRLLSWFKKFNKAWKNVDITDHIAIHRLRIRGKKLRYAIENIKPFFRQNTQEATSTLETLQKQLGNLHDNYRNRMIIHELLTEHAVPGLHYEAGILEGWQAFQTSALQQKLRQYHYNPPF